VVSAIAEGEKRKKEADVAELTAKLLSAINRQWGQAPPLPPPLSFWILTPNLDPDSQARSVLEDEDRHLTSSEKELAKILKMIGMEGSPSARQLLKITEKTLQTVNRLDYLLKELQRRHATISALDQRSAQHQSKSRSRSRSRSPPHSAGSSPSLSYHHASDSSAGGAAVPPLSGRDSSGSHRGGGGSGGGKTVNWAPGLGVHRLGSPTSDSAVKPQMQQQQRDSRRELRIQEELAALKKKTEAKKQVKSNAFDAADANGDGVIDREEWERATMDPGRRGY